MRLPNPSRPHWGRAIVMVACSIAITAALSACRGTEPSPKPHASATAATPAGSSPSPFPSTTATVIGTLDVTIALTTPQSHVPNPPISYTLLVHLSSDKVATAYPVASDGTFALTLPPGSYDVDVLEIQAADLGPDSFVLPLAGSQALRLRAPATGCVYGGEVAVTYGRLPAGTLEQQENLVDRASRNNNEQYSFVFRPDGGFVLAGAGASLPAPAKRPAAAQSCTAEEFTFVKATP